MDKKTYSRGDLVALLCGNMKKLGSNLEERADGIWWRRVDDHALEDLDLPEWEVYPHPTNNPRTEPLLPLPRFTAAQFVAFEDCVHLFREVYLTSMVCWERNEEEGTLTPVANRWTGIDENSVAGLQSPHAVELVSAILSNAGVEASGESAQQQPPTADRGRRVKRKALIAAHAQRWPTIERDLRDGSTNGLSAAAKAPDKGWWWEGSATEWARVQGKLDDGITEPVSSIFALGNVHRTAV